MTDTGNGPSTPSLHAAPSPVPVPEIQIRIRCRGKTSGSALDEARLGLEEARSQNRDPLLIFEDLGLLEDSVSTLIKGLCRILVGYPRTVTFWESSGYTEAFMTVMDAAPGPAS